MADLTRLIDDLEFLRDDISQQKSNCQRRRDMLQKRQTLTADEIKAQFTKLRAELEAGEKRLLSQVDTSIANAETVLVKDLRTLNDHSLSVRGLQQEADDMYVSNNVLNAADVLYLVRKYEEIQLDVGAIQNKKVCPVYMVDLHEMEFGRVEACMEFLPDIDGVDPDAPPPYSDIVDHVTVPVTFSARRDVDTKPAELTSIVWVRGTVAVTDKANKKVKFFAEEGVFRRDLLFPVGAPYGMAHTYTDSNGVIFFAVTIPSVRQICIVSFTPASATPAVASSFNTNIGYAGVAPGFVKNTLVVSVTSQTPRVDVIGYSGEIHASFTAGSMGEPLFSLPRYVLVNSNAIIVSDWRNNSVVLLDAANGHYIRAYKGTADHPLINPYDITVDPNSNIYIMDGKTGHIHVVNTLLELLYVIKDYEMAFNPRLLAFDGATNRIAVTHGAGEIELVPARVLPKDMSRQSTASSGTQDIKPSADTKHGARPGPLPIQLGPPTMTDQRCPSPRF